MVKSSRTWCSIISIIRISLAKNTKSNTYRYDLYVRAIDEKLISPLGRDARINVNILNQVRRVYLALPSHIQARVLLTAMEHSQSESEMNPEEQASLVRDLLSSGGVVSIKLAQMLAEEAKVPLYYRRLLGGLRESNEPMHVSLFWHSIPKSVRRHIKELGNCIGTGSVKQVHICRFDDGKDYAVAVLRRNVEEEALSSLDALTNAEDVAIVAKRLGRLVFGEFNLFSEGEALEEVCFQFISLHLSLSLSNTHTQTLSVFHNSNWNPRSL